MCFKSNTIGTPFFFTRYIFNKWLPPINSTVNLSCIIKLWVISIIIYIPNDLHQACAITLFLKQDSLFDRNCSGSMKAACFPLYIFFNGFHYLCYSWMNRTLEYPKRWIKQAQREEKHEARRIQVNYPTPLCVDSLCSTVVLRIFDDREAHEGREPSQYKF